MRKLYDVRKQKAIKQAAKRMSIEHNVTFNVIDVNTGKVVQTHEGHNAATNSLLTGIAHYLVGDGVYNQAYEMLSDYIPRYISLGTMGLFTQAADSKGLPIGLGADTDTLTGIDSNGNIQYYGDPKTERLCHYIAQCPGFGADGYDVSENNDRPYLGLGPKYDERDFDEPISCELINDTYPRTSISFRDIVPESESEIPKTIDIIYSGMISTGALAQFRGLNKDLSERTYLFITEAGLWSRNTWESGGDNGLLAGYRIVPPNQSNWDLGTYVEGYYLDPNNEDTWVPSHYELDPDDSDHAKKQLENQEILRKNILRVEKNQVVQVIWKIQIGGLEQLGGMSELYPSLESSLIWHIWDDVDAVQDDVDAVQKSYIAPSFNLLPEIGTVNVSYKVVDTKSIYRWNETEGEYVLAYTYDAETNTYKLVE